MTALQLCVIDVFYEGASPRNALNQPSSRRRLIPTYNRDIFPLIADPTPPPQGNDRHNWYRYRYRRSHYNHNVNTVYYPTNMGAVCLPHIETSPGIPTHYQRLYWNGIRDHQLGIHVSEIN